MTLVASAYTKPYRVQWYHFHVYGATNMLFLLLFMALLAYDIGLMFIKLVLYA